MQINARDHAGDLLSQQPAQRQIRALLVVALSIFCVTIVIGILNGTDLVTFNRKVLLMHVHVGTLGWLTLGVFAGALWLFGSSGTTGWRAALPRWLPYATAVILVLYAISFAITSGYVRVFLGTVAAGTLVLVFAWALAQTPAVGFSVPRFGFLLGLGTSVVGGTFGVLWGILIASGNTVKALPTDGEGAHPAAMVVGFLIPVGVAFAEWWLVPDGGNRKATKPGIAQMTLLCVASIVVVLSTLLGVDALAQIGGMLSVVAVGFIVVRLFPKLGRATDLVGTSGWFFAAATVFVAIDIVYLFGLIIAYQGKFDDVPRNLILTLDHIMFIGVMTNALFGFVQCAAGERRHLLPWADVTVFLLVEVGFVGFALGLICDTAIVKQLFTPLLGIGLLIGIGTYVTRLASSAQTTRSNTSTA